MSISDETVVLFLLIGVVIGIIYTANKAIIAIFSIKKLGTFLFDFTFAALCSVLTFIGTLAANEGYLRFIPAALEIIGALSFYFAAGDLLVRLIHFIKRGFEKKINPTLKRVSMGAKKRLWACFPTKRVKKTQKVSNKEKKSHFFAKKLRLRLEKTR